MGSSFGNIEKQLYGAAMGLFTPSHGHHHAHHAHHHAHHAPQAAPPAAGTGVAADTGYASHYAVDAAPTPTPAPAPAGGAPPSPQGMEQFRGAPPKLTDAERQELLNQLE
jgi:hypothetical protein